MRTLLESMPNLPIGIAGDKLAVKKLEVTSGPTPVAHLEGRVGLDFYRVEGHAFEQYDATYVVLLAVSSPESDALEDLLTSYQRP
jgi:hypothetical protein